MADIIYPLPEPVVKTIVSRKIRAKGIHIENYAQNPDGSTPSDLAGSQRMIMFEVEERDLLNDGFYAPTPPRQVKSVIRVLTTGILIATKTIQDPVTGQTVTISAAGVAKAMEDFFSSWWLEDNPPT